MVLVRGGWFLSVGFFLIVFGLIIDVIGFGLVIILK